VAARGELTYHCPYPQTTQTEDTATGLLCDGDQYLSESAGTMADNTTPPYFVMRRLIRPFEYRHLHAVGGVRLAAGGFQLGVGLVLVSLGRQARTDRERNKCYGWAAWFLGMAALQLLGGYMDMTVASSERRPPA
jgi:hypothetical protein